MHEIAIVKTNVYYGFGDEETRKVIESITEWVEVSTDDLKTLRDYSWAVNTDTIILEKLPPVAPEPAESVIGFLEKARAAKKREEDRVAKAKEDEKKKAATRAAAQVTKANKTLEQKKKLLEELKRELEEKA